MTDIKPFSRNYLRQYIPVVLLAVVIIFYQILTRGIFLKPMNVTNIIFQNSFILILAIGMMPLILAGKIDLAVGSIVGFIGAASAIFIIDMNMPILPAVVLCLTIGALIGAWQGFWIVYVKIPALIVTLADLFIFRFLTTKLLDGQSKYPYSVDFQDMVYGFLPELFQLNGINASAILLGILLSCLYIFLIFKGQKKSKDHLEVLPLWMKITNVILFIAAINLLTLKLSAYKGISIVLLLVICLIIIYYLLSNILKKQGVFMLFVNMGLLAALAGLIFAGRLNAASPMSGIGFELQTILACYIGGASLIRRIGSIRCAVIGVLVLGVLYNGMSIMGIGIAFQNMMLGITLLIIIALEVYMKIKTSSKSFPT